MSNFQFNLNNEKEFITKENILKHYQDVDIYQKYTTLKIQLGVAMLSPLMKDNKPSFGFFKGTTGEICFKDFRLGKGDFVKFVQLLKGCTYFEALSQIAIDFDLNDKYLCKKLIKTSDLNNQKIHPDRNEILKAVGENILKKNKRLWSTHDLEFWKKFEISYKTLLKYKVEPVKYIHINNKIIVADKYAYCFIEHKDNQETYKIYQPYNKHYKWLNNHNDSVWQGWSQLPSTGEILIITKSLKDVMCLHDVTGLPAVSLQNENVTPKENIVEQLRTRFKKIYLFYDNDFDKEINWGKQYGNKIAKELNLEAIYIPDEYKSKDFSDLVKNHNKEKALKIIKKLITQYE